MSLKTQHLNKKLIYSITKGKYKIFMSLLEAGVNINIGNRNRNPLLCALSHRGRKGFIKKLIDMGADVNFVLKSNRHSDETPLFYAININNLNYAKYLIKRGANVNFKNKKSIFTPFMLAINNRCPLDFISFLVLQGGANANDFIELFRLTPFNIALENEKCSVNLIKLLIENGADINRECYLDSNKNPLLTAVENGNIHIVRYLVENTNVDINIANCYNKTPIYAAVENRYYDIARYLISKGSNIHVGVCGNCILHWPILRGEFDIVKEFVEKYNFDINYSLFDACEFSNYDIVYYLIENGANIHNKDMYGRTTIECAEKAILRNIAEEQNQNKIIKLLKMLLTQDKIKEVFPKVSLIVRDVVSQFIF